MPNAPKRFRLISQKQARALAPSRRNGDWYNLAVWRGPHGLRLTQLRKTNWLCEECERQGRTTEAEHVDHIVDHEGSWQRFIDTSNLQSLCAMHHSAKTKATR